MEADADLFGMLRAGLKDMEAAFQACGHELVLLDALAVECHMADAIEQIGLPAQHAHTQVKQLQVAVVVAGQHAPLFIVVGIAEGDRPAVSGLRAVIHIASVTKKSAACPPAVSAAEAAANILMYTLPKPSMPGVECMCPVSLSMHDDKSMFARARMQPAQVQSTGAEHADPPVQWSWAQMLQREHSSDERPTHAHSHRGLLSPFLAGPPLQPVSHMHSPQLLVHVCMQRTVHPVAAPNLEVGPDGNCYPRSAEFGLCGGGQSSLRS